MIGHTVGHYRILERLGGGGMGVVYKAEDTKLGRSVALKFLPPELTRDTEARARFIQEARAAAQLDHPNICTVYDVGEADDDRIWIAMACYEGETLRKVIDEKRLSIDEALRIAMQLAKGLSKAHSSGIVHRDIKPANAIVTPDGIVKILDFGLAKLEGASQITGAGRTLGTTMYMAPEQLKGEHVGPQADIWALGVVLFELLTGQRPFRGEYEQAAVYSILNEEPSSVSAIRPEAPKALEGIVRRMLRRDPRERYKSIDEVIADLDAFSGARSIPFAGASGAGKGRVVRSIAVAAILLLAAAALAFVASQSTRQAKPVEASAPRLPDKPVVGILPFQDISEESLAPMMGAGFANALSARLGAIEGLQTLSAAGEDLADGLSIGERCRKVGANLLLRGTLQRSGQTIRATWTIVNAEGRQLGGSYADVPVGELLALQDAVSRQLLDALSRPEALSAVAVQSGDSFAEDRYIQAIGYLTRYDDRASVDSAIEILETLGASPRIQAALGNAYLHRYLLSGREIDWAIRAREACKRAAAGNDDDPDVHRTLGKIAIATSKLDEAEAEFLRALELRPGDAETILAYADLLDRQNREKEAEEQILKAIALRPGNWSGHNRLGTFFVRRGRNAEALKAFGEAERLTPENNFVITNIGATLQSMGRYDEAVAAYQRSIRVRPTGPAYNNLGALLYYLGRYDDAVDAFERATALDPTDYQIWGGLGDSLRWSEKGKAKAPAAFRKAIELAEKELELSPRDPMLLSVLAVCQAKAGDTVRAVQTARLAVETAPENAIVSYYAGIAMEVAGQRQEAVTMIKYALEHGYTQEEARREPELRALINETNLLRGKGGA
ncbi:MAG: protein kinase [Thermoanaerobaculia bacterium]|nr:protein kinase [Thermoanaerobaculia bacterium]